MTFTVVDSLLGEAIHHRSPAMVMQAPRGWVPLDSTRVAGLAATAGGQAAAGFRLSPREACFDPVNGCVLVVSDWSSDSVEAWDEVVALRRGLLDRQFSAHPPRHDLFLLGQHLCLQSLVQDSAMVTFKLMLENGVQLDYLVPKSCYAAQAESIASSMGSIRYSPTSTPE